MLDLCPQANCSMMLLGGGNTGRERSENFQIEMRTCVSAYLKQLYINLLGENDFILNLESYCVKVSDYNDKVPNNLYLLPGIFIISYILFHI